MGMRPSDNDIDREIREAEAHGEAAERQGREAASRAASAAAEFQAARRVARGESRRSTAGRPEHG